VKRARAPPKELKELEGWKLVTRRPVMAAMAEWGTKTRASMEIEAEDVG
jgi:hypothetical protein